MQFLQRGERGHAVEVQAFELVKQRVRRGLEEGELSTTGSRLPRRNRQFAVIVVMVRFQLIEDHVGTVDDIVRNPRQSRDMNAVAAIGRAGNDFV